MNITELCVGPMSLNIINAIVNLNNEYGINLPLISSRRQIETNKIGKGYVNNFTTEEYSKYINSIDTKKNIKLCRDHGGPWQSSEAFEKDKYTETNKNCELSFEQDILSGFKYIHIDPSINLNSKKELIDRIENLYCHCINFARKKNKDIYIELGKEEQTDGFTNDKDLEEFIISILDMCKKNNLPKPNYIVDQFGTLVKETKNIGQITKDDKSSWNKFHSKIEIFKKYNIKSKIHNADYLKPEILKKFNKVGVDAINIAPEIGVLETRKLIEVCKEHSLRKEIDDFLEISLSSLKWQKWLINENNINDYDKAIISGHYIFSDIDFVDLKKRITFELKKKQIDLNKYLINEIRDYLKKMYFYIND